MPLYNPASSASTDSAYEISNLTITTSVAANALTIALKTKSAGDASATDIIYVGQRSSTLSTGTYTRRSITGALSMVVSSGSTLGHSSGGTHNIWVYAIDNAGTLEIAVSQTLYPETGLLSTTAEGGAGAADSNSTAYSTTARTNVAFRLVGLLVSTQTTAGTWASNMTQVFTGDYGMLSPKDDVTFIGNGASSSAVGTNTNLVYASIVDPMNGYAAADGSWTANITSKYKVSVSGRVAGSGLSLNQYNDVKINVNGSDVREGLVYVQATGVTALTGWASWEGVVTAGQKIKCVVDTTMASPTLTTSANHTYMEIVKIN